MKDTFEPLIEPFEVYDPFEERRNHEYKKKKLMICVVLGFLIVLIIVSIVASRMHKNKHNKTICEEKKIFFTSISKNGKSENSSAILIQSIENSQKQNSNFNSILWNIVAPSLDPFKDELCAIAGLGLNLMVPIFNVSEDLSCQLESKIFHFFHFFFI